MKKRSKKQVKRDRLRNRKRLKKNRKKKTSKDNFKAKSKLTVSDYVPWQAPKLSLYEFENPFNDIPFEKRRECINEIGEKYEKIYNENYASLRKWFEDYDALYLLSFCSVYFVSTQEGVDLEAYGEMDFYHHYLELLQAFALTKPRNYEMDPLFDKVYEFKELVQKIGEAMNLKSLKLPTGCISDEDVKAYHLRMEMISRTTAIRNYAYSYQIEKIILDLGLLIKDEFEKVYGIDPVCFFKALFKIPEIVNERLNNHLTKVKDIFKQKNYKDMLSSYIKNFPNDALLDKEDIELLWEKHNKNLKNLFSTIACYLDFKLENIFTITLDEIVQLYGDSSKRKEIKSILSKLSYEFGDLKDENIDYFVLNNPVHVRPFINLDNESYFSTVTGIIHHLSLDIFEYLILESEGLNEKYEKVKPIYLEDCVATLFEEAFPGANIYKNVKWRDESEGKDYETDLIVLVDNFLLVIESKAGKIPSIARRGEPVSLFRVLKKLIEAPSEQAHRFIKYLVDNKNSELTCCSGSFNLDIEQINHYIPLGVTFSHFGFISTNLKKLIEAKVTDKSIEELAPSISFTDLEDIFELLPMQGQKLHYLQRRREIEDQLCYEGDELDLLSFYLDNGFNIGEAEYDPEFLFNIMLKSKELDLYFVGSRQGVGTLQPSVDITEWWNDILEFIDLRKPTRWADISFVLLNVAKSDQIKFESMFKALSKKVKKGSSHKYEWVSLRTSPDQRSFFIAAFPYINLDTNERNNVLAEIINSKEAEGVKGVIVIGVNIDSKDYPYSVIGGKWENDLFDAKFQI